jgi:hypothetical protein
LKKLNLVPNYYPAPFPWHITAKELKEKIGDKFQSYFKFGFVRDPWDLQASLYIFMLKLESHDQHRMIKRMSNFDEYVDWRVNKDLKLQKTFFYDDSDNLIVDHVGKFENLQNDFDHICQRLNITAQLTHINKSREHSDLGLYTQKSIDIIEQAFYPDILAFRYKKPVLQPL